MSLREKILSFQILAIELIRNIKMGFGLIWDGSISFKKVLKEKIFRQTEK